jgi:hypothetical protein
MSIAAFKSRLIEFAFLMTVARVTVDLLRNALKGLQKGI